MEVAIHQVDSSVSDPNSNFLGYALLGQEVERLVTLDRQPAENRDPLPRPSPAGLGTDEDFVTSKILRQLMSGAVTEGRGHFLKADDVQPESRQFTDKPGPALGPA